MSASPAFLVVGSGSIARRHMANLRQLFSAATIFCVSASGRVLAPDELPPGVVACADLAEALLATPLLAIIASPAPAHVAHAAAVLRAGVPVFMEKPLADSLASVAAEADLLRAHRDRIEVGYNLRYMPSAVALKALLDEGRIGRIQGVASEVGQYLPDWRPGQDYRQGVSARRALGGGALLELSHELDYLLWLFGAFDTAYCVTSNSGALGIDVEDCVDAILSKQDGFSVRLHLDFLQRAPVRSCRIIGERGTLLWNLMGNSVTLSGPGGQEETLFSDPAWDRNDMYLQELARFVRVARGELAPAVDLGQGLATLALVEALKASAHRGCAVTLGEFPA